MMQAKAEWLVIRPGALGDAVLTLPALALLIGAGIRPTVVGDRRSWDFLDPDDGRMAIADIESRDWRGLFATDGFSRGERGRIARYDGAILYLGQGQDLVRHALTEAGVERLFGATPVRPSEPVQEHAAERLLRPIGEILGQSVPLGTASATADRLLRLGVSRADPRLVLHPGSGGRNKRWPVERFAALARIAGDRWGLKPLILLGPAERESEPILRALLSGTDGASFAVDRPLPELMALLAQARAYVGNDSGVSHLAARLVPSLVLFGPTDPAVWRPLGPSVKTLRKGLELSALGEKEVAAALGRLIGQPP